jgi:hypothetical protein
MRVVKCKVFGEKYLHSYFYKHYLWKGIAYSPLDIVVILDPNLKSISFHTDCVCAISAPQMSHDEHGGELI